MVDIELQYNRFIIEYLSIVICLLHFYKNINNSIKSQKIYNISLKGIHL